MSQLSQNAATSALTVRLSRRALAAVFLVSTVVATASGMLTAGAQQKAAPKEVAVDELMKPGELPDIVVGKPDAPVTIVEYASMTCPHCAVFHNSVLPGLKEKYLDTGKARMIFREFPLDNVAAAASMLARCAGPDKTASVVSKLFETQENWAFVRGSAVPGLFKVAETVGFTQDTFDKCLKDEALLKNIIAMRERASKTFGVNSTPTFFINGKRLDGRSDQLATFEQAIDPLLSK
ncbi:MAG TPA: DsbA family protein [Hyphomicrobiaceae bacterium]|nr:DsbA family protein [Hyphomicrobiaceae bacterium]